MICQYINKFLICTEPKVLRLLIHKEVFINYNYNNNHQTALMHRANERGSSTNYIEGS